MTTPYEQYEKDLDFDAYYASIAADGPPLFEDMSLQELMDRSEILGEEYKDLITTLDHESSIPGIAEPFHMVFLNGTWYILKFDPALSVWHEISEDEYIQAGMNEDHLSAYFTHNGIEL